MFLTEHRSLKIDVQELPPLLSATNLTHDEIHAPRSRPDADPRHSGGY